MYEQFVPLVKIKSRRMRWAEHVACMGKRSVEGFGVATLRKDNI
jgi:hypothetical protein